MTTTTCSLGDLAPDARAALDEYLGAVGATVDADLRDAVVCDLRTWMLDHLDVTSTAADVRALADEAGPVDDAAEDGGEAAASGPWTGTWHGIPYDFTPPTWAKLTRRLWDPADPALWRGHMFGAGWTPNFGALAVRLGLIEPDAEAEPFVSTPGWALAAAAAVPAGLAKLTILHYAVRGGSLPAALPSHWGLDGSPDRWTSKRSAVATDVATTVVPALVGAWAAASGRRGPARAGVLAAAAGVATLGGLTTVIRPLPDRPRPWVGPAMVAGFVGATGATLLALALAGRRAEQRKDLGR